MILVLMGNDGVGKTTYAKCVIEQLAKSGVRAMYVHVDFLFLKPVRVLGKLLSKRSPVCQETDQITPSLKRLGRRRRVKMAFMYASMIDYILMYYLFLWPLSFFYTVVCDRYFYDHIVRFAEAGIYEEDEICFMLRYIPQPDKNILLDATPSTAYDRKHELGLSLLAQRRDRYLQLVKEIVPRPHIIRTDLGNKEEVAAWVWEAVSTSSDDEKSRLKHSRKI